MTTRVTTDGEGVFEAPASPRLVCGPRSVEHVGDLAARMGAVRVLLVSDPGVEAAGHTARAEQALRGAGLDVTTFDGVIENPTSREVEACAGAIRESKANLIVALGGGSTLDTAKGANLVAGGGGRIEDYQGPNSACGPLLPTIAIPTTAGTGSESQSFAIIVDARTHIKMACGDPGARPAVAILDPELTLTQPFHVTAHTGIDALSHALESAVTRRRNPLSSLYAREAFRLAAGALPALLERPGDLAARGEMQLAATLAGMAIECSMLGAAHAAANPLSALAGLVHGRAVGLMLPAVIRYNAEDPAVAAVYHDLMRAAELPVNGSGGGAAGPALAELVESLLGRCGMPRRLSELGLARSEIEGLAAQAEQQWTGTFNPRRVGRAEFVSLYESVYG